MHSKLLQTIRNIGISSQFHIIFPFNISVSFTILLWYNFENLLSRRYHICVFIHIKYLFCKFFILHGTMPLLVSWILVWEEKMRVEGLSFTPICYEWSQCDICFINDISWELKLQPYLKWKVFRWKNQNNRIISFRIILMHYNFFFSPFSLAISKGKIVKCINETSLSLIFVQQSLVAIEVRRRE